MPDFLRLPRPLHPVSFIRVPRTYVPHHTLVSGGWVGGWVSGWVPLWPARSVLLSVRSLEAWAVLSTRKRPPTYSSRATCAAAVFSVGMGRRHDSLRLRPSTLCLFGSRAAFHRGFRVTGGEAFEKAILASPPPSFPFPPQRGRFVDLDIKGLSLFPADKPVFIRYLASAGRHKPTCTYNCCFEG